MGNTIQDIWDVRARPGKHIGIEIEMEGENLQGNFHKWWAAVGDGSLRGAALEYVLRVPCERGKVMQRLTYLQDSLKHAGSKLEPSDRCGVHIHVNCQDLTSQEVINFAILYLIFEDILVKWCGEQREGNLFCLRASDADRIIQGLVRCRQDDSLNHMQRDEYRYGAINLSAIQKYGSVEFRAMASPKNFESINTWAQMLLKVQDASRLYKEPHEIIEDLSRTGGGPYVRRVFQEYAKELRCPELQDLCLDGVRRVQEIAYTQMAPTARSSKSNLGPRIEELEEGAALRNHVPEWFVADNGQVAVEPPPLVKPRKKRIRDRDREF